MLLVLKIKSFQLTGSETTMRMDLNMRWSFTSSLFSNGDGRVNDFCGTDGVFYYHPSIKAKLKDGNVGDLLKTLPIFPSAGKVLLPLGTEIINVFEMRHRELFSQIQDKYFALSYISQQKLSLVGTIARVVNNKLCDDGRFYATVEGIERFYISDIKSDKPFIKGNVYVFHDTSSSIELMEELENKVYSQVRINLKLMHLLSPRTFYPNIILYRPYLSDIINMRIVNMDEKNTLDRQTKFSFAVIDILQVNNHQKLSLMQETVLERRYVKLLSLLQKGELSITNELKSKGIITNEGIRLVKQEILDHDSFNVIETPNNLFPENFMTDHGKWTQQPILM